MTDKISHSKLCIGLPVFNGDQYIAETIQSILNQTYANFKLIITDNASNDQTEEICLAFSQRDNRIHYHRNEENIGAAENFNLVFQMSQSPYFKWAAHDDVLSPDFLERCISVLDEDPDVVLSYTKATKIDSDGNVTGNYDYDMDVEASRPQDRFRDLVLVKHFCISAFGVMRRNALAKTKLIGKYVGSDRNMIAELGLMGRQVEIPEYLFRRRQHPQASTEQYKKYDRLVWFDPNLKDHLHFPYWRVGFEYFRSILRVPLSLGERLSCIGIVIRWYFSRRKLLLDDLVNALLQLFPFLRRISRTIKNIRGGKLFDQGGKLQ